MLLSNVRVLLKGGTIMRRMHPLAEDEVVDDGKNDVQFGARTQRG